MPECGARSPVWVDGELLHNCLNLKAIRNSWFQGNACLLYRSKSSNSGDMGVPSWPRSLLILVSAPPMTCSKGREKINKCLTHWQGKGAWLLLLQKIPLGEVGRECSGSRKQWVPSRKLSAQMQNLASALVWIKSRRFEVRASEGLVRQLTNDLDFNRKPLWKERPLLLDIVNFWITRFGSALGHSENPGLSKPAFPFASGHILPKAALWRIGTVKRAPQLFTCLSGWWVFWSLCFSLHFLIMRQPFLTGDRDHLWEVPTKTWAWENSYYSNFWSVPISWVTFAAFSSFFFNPCFLIMSALGRSESCLVRQHIARLSALGWSFPSAAGAVHGLCYPVIALHSVWKLMLSLFLVG